MSSTGYSDKDFLQSAAIPDLDDKSDAIELQEVLNEDQRMLARLKSGVIFHNNRENLLDELKSIHRRIHKILTSNSKTAVLVYAAIKDFPLVINFLLDIYKNLLGEIENQIQKYFSENPNTSFPSEKSQDHRELVRIIVDDIINAYINASHKTQIRTNILAKLDSWETPKTGWWIAPKNPILDCLLYKMSAAGDYLAVQELLKHGASSNYYTDTPVYGPGRQRSRKISYTIDVAAEAGHAKVVKLLLLSENIQLKDLDCIKFAYRNGHHDIVKILNDFVNGTRPSLDGISTAIRQRVGTVDLPQSTSANLTSESKYQVNKL